MALHTDFHGTLRELARQQCQQIQSQYDTRGERRVAQHIAIANARNLGKSPAVTERVTFGYVEPVRQLAAKLDYGYHGAQNDVAHYGRGGMPTHLQSGLWHSGAGWVTAEDDRVMRQMMSRKIGEQAKTTFRGTEESSTTQATFTGAEDANIAEEILGDLNSLEGERNDADPGKWTKKLMDDVEHIQTVQSSSIDEESRSKILEQIADLLNTGINPEIKAALSSLQSAMKGLRVFAGPARGVPSSFNPSSTGMPGAPPSGGPGPSSSPAMPAYTPGPPGPAGPGQSAEAPEEEEQESWLDSMSRVDPYVVDYGEGDGSFFDWENNVFVDAAEHAARAARGVIRNVVGSTVGRTPLSDQTGTNFNNRLDLRRGAAHLGRGSAALLEGVSGTLGNMYNFAMGAAASALDSTQQAAARLFDQNHEADADHGDEGNANEGDEGDAEEAVDQGALERQSMAANIAANTTGRQAQAASPPAAARSPANRNPFATAAAATRAAAADRSNAAVDLPPPRAPSRRGRPPRPAPEPPVSPEFVKEYLKQRLGATTSHNINARNEPVARLLLGIAHNVSSGEEFQRQVIDPFFPESKYSTRNWEGNHPPSYESLLQKLKNSLNGGAARGRLGQYGELDGFGKRGGKSRSRSRTRR